MCGRACGLCVAGLCLADRVKEDVDEVGVLGDGEHGILDGEGVVEGAVDEAGRVDEGDQVEAPLLGGGHLQGSLGAGVRGEGLRLRIRVWGRGRGWGRVWVWSGAGD